LARDFNTVDTYDVHDKLGEYIKSIRDVNGGKVNVVGTGWDPGLFSIIRVYFDAMLHPTVARTFWGRGVSLGHTNAIRGIAGVVDAIQFTIPVVREGKHRRECNIVADSSDHARIESEIRNMPNYFAGQDVVVNFVDQKTFNRRFRNRQEHGGIVLAADDMSRVELELRLKSNPHFTAQVMLAYAVANFRLQQEGKSGVYTVADIAPKYLAQGDVLGRI